MERFVKVFAIIIFIAGVIYFYNYGIILKKILNLQEATVSSFRSNIIYEHPGQYINQIRKNVGLIPLKHKAVLDKSAYNHAFYAVVHNEKSHDEREAVHHFTGKTPTDRAFHVGYNSSVSESINFNSKNYQSSINELMTAIYHRFAFLDFERDEIGYAFYDGKTDKASLNKETAFVFVLGNSILEEYCQQNQMPNQAGKQVYGFCKNKELNMSIEEYEKALNLNKLEYIYYPNAKNAVVGTFSGEIPEPIPDCKITSNPVSIQFNPAAADVKMLDFSVYDQNGKKIEDTIVMDKDSDPNKLFKDNQFALFSKKPFDIGGKYRAEFNYLQNGEKKKINWDFAIQHPEYDYFVVKEKQSAFFIERDKYYDIYIEPNNCNDLVDEFVSHYPANVKLDVTSPRENLIRIKVSGRSNQRIEIKTASRSIKFYF